MATPAGHTFGDLLRQYRAAASLTQEDLARRANLSVRGISDLERGLKQRPYPNTVRRLVHALDLGEREARRLRWAAHHLDGSDVTDEPAPSERHSLPLPIQLTSFVGRRQQVEGIRTLLGREEVRLLTLTGPGGVGKTRLALQAAAEMRSVFPDGTAFVSLAQLGDPELVLSSIAAGVGLKEVGEQSILQTLTGRLRDKRLLLLLDNFEHLLDAAGVVPHLLVACPQITVLVTSRAVLHLAAEHEYLVPPLPVPSPRHFSELDALSSYDAVQLFVQRARAVQPGFTLTEGNAGAIAEICSKVDGLPLGIELVAARIRLFPPQALAGRLSNRLEMLTGGPSDVPTRQQTLRQTIDWSYSLLSPEEQSLFSRLSVFTGGWSLEAAQAVCADAENQQERVVTLMESLVSQSLLLVAEQAGEPRFCMLETIREYAAERLEWTAEGESVRAWHARYYLQFSGTAAPELWTGWQRTWLGRLQAEQDNLRGALRWMLAGGVVEDALLLAAELLPYWEYRGYWSEGRGWLEEGLSRGEGVASSVRAAALWSLGVLLQGRDEQAEPRLEEALALYRNLGDRRGSARVLNTLGNIARNQGQYELATALYEESLHLSRKVEDGYRIGIVVQNLAIAALEQGNLCLARKHSEETLAIGRAVGRGHALYQALWIRGAVALYDGNLAEAEARSEEALALARAWGATFQIAKALRTLGVVARMRGQAERAWDCTRESLALARERGQRPVVLELLADVAALAMATDQAKRAACLQGAVAALRARLRIPLPPVERTEWEETLERIRVALSERDFVCACERGRAMTLDEAVACALTKSG
jgi:predicted ATPase/DNA-binding XRE family transcriptional regulator